MIQYSIEKGWAIAGFKILMGIVTIGVIEMLLSYRKKKKANKTVFSLVSNRSYYYSITRILFIRRSSVI
ncbi:hypothetical protein MCOL2_03101 [Listeria fleischmannii FSL S10-1203]|uniref:Uncharacterized protein n=1 Tax=Listeria fleischmannii FSL S10-1203 TaxID=1265822 RepID=W7DPQ9_9LIST|nr:hypothetical protein MCOL2_03101 [Listeria fleischmannii FSL S10-1203]